MAKPQQVNMLPNNRMQSDKLLRCAPQFAADARRGKSDVTLLAGRDVSLRFKLRRARLYAFGFIGAGPSREAQGLRVVPDEDVDLERVIEVGPEIVQTDERGRRQIMHAANQRCARTGRIIGEFDPARVFEPLPGQADRVYFHADYVGRIKPPE